MLSINSTSFHDLISYLSDDARLLEHDFISEITPLLHKNNDIDKTAMTKYDVKIGPAKQENGTGVRVGLTHIADVRGYDIDENKKKIPIPGKLFYRGINVEDIVNSVIRENRFGYEKFSYLLLFGELPDRKHLENYTKLLGLRRELPPYFTRNMIMASPSRSIMNQIARNILALYAYDDKADDTSLENVLRQSILLISCFPTIAAYSYQAKCSHFYNQSLHLHYPLPELSTAENILRLIRRWRIH